MTPEKFKKLVLSPDPVWPNQINVGGYLDLSGCTGLTSIKGIIKGLIYLDKEIFGNLQNQNLLDYKGHFKQDFQILIEKKIQKPKIKLKTRFDLLKEKN